LSEEEKFMIVEFLMEKIQPYFGNTIFYDIPEEIEDQYADENPKFYK